MLSIEFLRKFRLDLEDSPKFVNSSGKGIALFDLLSTFLGFIIFQNFLAKRLPGRNKLLVYYLSVIPIGVAVHYISKKLSLMEKNTFLNSKLFDDSEINIYKIMISLIIIGIVIGVIA